MSIFVQVGPFAGFNFLGTVGFCGWPGEETLYCIHIVVSVEYRSTASRPLNRMFDESYISVTKKSLDISKALLGVVVSGTPTRTLLKISVSILRDSNRH